MIYPFKFLFLITFRLCLQTTSSMHVDLDEQNLKKSKENVLLKLQEELKRVAQRDTNSILRQKDFDTLANLNLMKIVDEMIRICPTAYEVIFALLEMDVNFERKIPAMVLIYGLIMFKRFHEMSLLQRLNSLILIDGDANQEVL